MNRSLAGLKAGDTVWVVRQIDTLFKARGMEVKPRQHPATVAKVGRTYAYLRNNERFKIENGESYSPSEDNLNSRANGLGFDVYRSKEDYDKYQQAIIAADELKHRLIDRFGNLCDMPPLCVQKMHEILDEFDIPKKV